MDSHDFRSATGQPPEFSVPFNIDKAIESVAHLLGEAGAALSRFRVVKLLYLADRKLLAAAGRPIVGGTYFSLPHGPVTSELLDAIKSPVHRHWQDHFQNIDNPEKSLVCIRPAGSKRLSKAERRILSDVFFEHRDKTDRQLEQWTHTELREYRDPGESRLPITLSSIFDAVGKDKAETAELIEQLEIETSEDRILG